MVNLRCELCDNWLSLFQVGKLCEICYEIRTIVKCYDAESIKLCLDENFKVVNEYKNEEIDEPILEKKCLTKSDCDSGTDADDEEEKVKVKVKKLNKVALEQKVKDIIKNK